MHVIEIGAGRGTLAKDMLQYFSLHNPQFLDRLKYTTIDVSPTLSTLQRVTLQPWVDSNIVHVVCKNAVDWLSTFVPLPKHHVHIIATEVLDNMPHDLVEISANNELVQAHIDVENSALLTWEPTLDNDTQLAIDAFDLTRASSLQSSVAALFDTVINGGSRQIWVPTLAFQLLRTLVSRVPTASLTFSDFTSFPGSLPGFLAPVIQRVNRGTAVVYDSIECAPFGTVDIMFPTNFECLSHAHMALFHQLETCRQTSQRVSFHRDVITHYDFFKRFAPHGDVVNSTCLDGYNPVLQDFKNTSYLLVDVRD